jgi:exodeoxyribonuclease VII small subunit
MAEEKLGYEAARAELIEVVRALEAGGTTLEESLALWERGEKLATVCQDWLDGARARLDSAIEDDEPS